MAENELPKCLLAIFKKINQIVLFGNEKSPENQLIIK
jgi:hypothetical protein